MDKGTPQTHPPEGMYQKPQSEVDRLAIKALTEQLDNLISACLEDGGPSKQAIARARGYLPLGYKNSYQQ